VADSAYERASSTLSHDNIIFTVGTAFLHEVDHRKWLLFLFFTEVSFSVTDLLVLKCLYDRDLFGHCRAFKWQANEKRII